MILSLLSINYLSSRFPEVSLIEPDVEAWLGQMTSPLSNSPEILRYNVTEPEHSGPSVSSLHPSNV